MVSVDSIKGYWANSELSALATLDFNGKSEDQKIQDAIDDAVIELSPIVDSLEQSVADLFVKRLTICILITKLNISLDAVEAQMDEGKAIRALIEKYIVSKLDIQIKQDNADQDAKTSKLVVTAGSKVLHLELDGYME